MKDIMRRFARYEATYKDIPKELFNDEEKRSDHINCHQERKQE